MTISCPSRRVSEKRKGCGTHKMAATEMRFQGPIVLVGTLDTKGDEFAYLKEELTAAGADPVVVDVGVLGAPLFSPDVSREQIASLAGTSLEQLVRDEDRGTAVSAMAQGFAAWAREQSGKRFAAGAPLL